MSELENNTANSSTGTQREQIMQQLTGVKSRLESKGVGAAFHRVAKADPVGDMGFAGSLFLHALMLGPVDGLIGEILPAIGHGGELDSALALGGMEGAAILSETQEDRPVRRPKSSFYPLGRNKSKINEPKIGKEPAVAVANNRNGRFSNDAYGELAFMFQLMDTLNKLEAQEAGKTTDKSLHLVTKQPSSTVYQGVERRRRPRPEGMFSA